jgi:hypothetical protein
MADLEGDSLVQIGVAGALSHELRNDHAAFVQYLASAFERAFPNETELKFEGGFFTKKQLVGVAIRLGDDQFTLVKPSRGSLQATKTHVVRGIALKTEPMQVEQWLQEVSARLEAQVAHDQQARSTLASALGIR